MFAVYCKIEFTSYGKPATGIQPSTLALLTRRRDRKLGGTMLSKNKPRD